MKTFDEILTEVAAENQNAGNLNQQLNEAAKRYATQAIKEHLERAAENAEMNNIVVSDAWGAYEAKVIDKQSITEIEIILK